MSKKDITTNIKEFYNKDLDIKTTKNKLGLKDTGTWNSEKARNNGSFNENYFEKIQYRPFDNLNIYYDNNLIDCNRINVMKHFINGNKNIGLVVPRQAVTDNWSHIQVTDFMIDNRIHYSNKGTPICCPLYLYPETTTQQNLLETKTRTPNLNPEIIKQIADGLGLSFTNEKETEGEVCFANSEEVRPEFKQSFAPIDLLDYIYAVLHSPTYREKYKEFLKIDFPRVPYPKAPSPSERAGGEDFWQLVKLGGELRQIHLLESPTVSKYITQYPEDGNNIVTKPKYEQRNYVVENDTITHNDTIEPIGRVHINEKQYFDNVPEVAWNFYIGGYQPAQKWLKDRKGRELSYEDILHYQKIIVALSETDRIMKEIDRIEI